MGKVGAVALAVVALLGVSVVVYLLGPQTPAPEPPAPAGSERPDSGVPADAERARVTAHVDGDTLRLAGEEGSRLLPDEETRVRLLEIDAPEEARDGRPAECHAVEAGDALAHLLPVGAPLWVDRDEELFDPYGRTLLYLWTVDGDFVNLELVRQGHARAVLFEPNDEHIAAVRRAESAARAAGRGLWGAC